MLDERVLLRRGVLLEGATLVWNVAGVVILMVSAQRAHSIALLGFGLDSLLEIGASALVLRELSRPLQNQPQRALRWMSGAFFMLATYVLITSFAGLLSGARSQPTSAGIIWLSLTFFLMLALAWGKRRIGRRLQNRVLIAESRVTLVDAYLAGAVLIGVIADTKFGWWQADPLAGLVIALYAFREGWHAWKEGA